MLKSARDVFESQVDWTIETIETRSRDMSDWALERWPY